MKSWESEKIPKESLNSLELVVPVWYIRSFYAFDITFWDVFRCKADLLDFWFLPRIFKKLSAFRKSNKNLPVKTEIEKTVAHMWLKNLYYGLKFQKYRMNQLGTISLIKESKNEFKVIFQLI